MADTLKKTKTIIIVLSILLVLSLTALAVVIYNKFDLLNGSDVIPDNYIKPTYSCEFNENTNTMRLGTMPVILCASMPNSNLPCGIPVMALFKTVIASDSAKETVISIYKRHAEDSEPFRLSNMLPGDSETKTYLVEISHKGTVTVRFHADIRAGYEKLSEVLKCKVVLRGEKKPLYDGLMRDMPESIDHRISSVYRKTTELAYDITVYLDTGVGNEYMNKELVADFRWWVEEIGGVPIPPHDPGETTAPDDAKEPDNTTVPDDPKDPNDTDDPDGVKEPDDTIVPDDPKDPNDNADPDDPKAPDDTDDQKEPDDGELVAPLTGDDTYFYILVLLAMISLLILLWQRQHRTRGN